MAHGAFHFLAFLALAGALTVVLARNPIYSAVALVLTLMSTAGLFLSLGAQFLAVVQVIVYAGAIVVLFIFVLMLLNLRSGEGGEEQLHRVGFGQSLGVGLAALLFLQLGLLAFSKLPGGIIPAIGSSDLEARAGGHSQAIGLLLYSKYLLAFEVASVLLLVAVIGAVALSRRHLVMGEGRDESTEEVP